MPGPDSRQRRAYESAHVRQGGSALSALLLLAFGQAVGAQSRTDLGQMSLDSLLAIPVHAAARYAQSTSDAPAAVTVVTADEIAAFGYRTLDQILARAAGFYVSYDRNYTYIGVRGFSRPTDYNNRILLLLNGHPMNEGVYGAAPVGTELGVDLAVLDRVEIVRGPVSALYGTSAMFAVVNLITAQPTGTGGGVTAELGQAGHVTAGGSAYTSSSPDRDFLITGHYGRDDGRDLYYAEHAHDGSDGIARNLDWSRWASAFGSARIGNLRVQARASTREKGIPTASWETAFNHPDSWTVDSWAQVAGTYDLALHPALQLSLSLTGDLYRYRGSYPEPDLSFTDATDAHQLGAGVQAVWDVSTRNRLVTGIALSHLPRADYITIYGGEVDFDIDEPYSRAGFYAQDELHVTRWLTLNAGGRLDVESGSSARITPRGSAILRPADGTTVKLLYGAAFRSPNIYERYFYGDGDDRSADLRAERIITREIVGEQRLSTSTSLRVSLFSDQVTDLIDAVVDPATDEYSYANVGRVTTRGVEAEFTIAAGGWLVQGGGVVQSAVDRDTGERLTNAPRATLRLGANGGLYGGLAGAAQVRAETGRLTVGGSETSAFGLLDLNLAYRPTARVRSSLSATNVFNQSYAYPGGVEHLQDSIGQDGRRLRLRLEISR